MRKPVGENGVILALASAILFGLSTPFAKMLHVQPVLLAGLLYGGSGIGLGLWKIVLSQKQQSGEALNSSDLPWLGGAIVSGGIVAPVLLLVGLTKTPASTAALLLNLEAIFTAVIAWGVFREHVNHRTAWGMILIVLGGLALAWGGSGSGVEGGLSSGAPWIVGACLCWGIDNNLTRKVSAGDPVLIACVKGIVAGLTNCTLAWLLGAHWPGVTTVAWAFIVGFFGYGVSLTCFVWALRLLGTARTGAYFSAAPFFGTVMGIILLGEPIHLDLIFGGVLMLVGVWLHLSENHSHIHVHEEMEHEHMHSHDEHHQHSHCPEDPMGEPHSHWHRHDRIIHSHPHYPDIHHRHTH